MVSKKLLILIIIFTFYINFLSFYHCIILYLMRSNVIAWTIVTILWSKVNVFYLSLKNCCNKCHYYYRSLFIIPQRHQIYDKFCFLRSFFSSGSEKLAEMRSKIIAQPGGRQFIGQQSDLNYHQPWLSWFWRFHAGGRGGGHIQRSLLVPWYFCCLKYLLN